MPIGTGTFIPSPEFALPRSYLRGIDIFIDAPVTQAGNVFSFNDSGIPLTTYFFVFDTRFMLWSSNRWTLDYMLTDVYSHTAGSPSFVERPFSLSYVIRPEDDSPYVRANVFNAAWTTHHYYQLPPAPPGYWQPPW